MCNVLKSFGIDPSNLKPVPLKEYNWNSVSTDNLPDSLTISHRIKSMTRAARHKIKVTNGSGVG